LTFSIASPVLSFAVHSSSFNRQDTNLFKQKLNTQ
jgi:hypothetical protein